jgi:hypothetical protein
MNPRIRELAEECTDRHFSECSGGFETFDKEKFAELIVRECANLCLNPNHWYEDAAGETFNQVIKEHFGVER